MRKQFGSHDRLATKLGTSRQTIIRWERGSFPRAYVEQLRELGVPEELLTQPQPEDRFEGLERRVELLEDLGRESAGSIRRLERLVRRGFEIRLAELESRVRNLEG